MPPKKPKFPPQKDKLSQFFKPITRKPDTKDATSSVADTPPTSTTKSENELPVPRPAAKAQSLSSEPQMTSSQRIIKDSDEEESDLSDPTDSDEDIPGRPPSRPTPTAITNGKNGQPSFRFEPAEAQPISSEPWMTSQLSVEDSEGSELSDVGSDSDLSDPSLPHAISHELTSTSAPTRELPALSRAARPKAAPYTKPKPKRETKDSGSSSDTPPTTTTKKESGRLLPKPDPSNVQFTPTRTKMTPGQQAFGDPFNDEDSGSDSDLPDLFTRPTTSPTSDSRSTRKLRGHGSTTKSRESPYASPLTFQPKHKYKFSITSLVSQSQKHLATEASAQRAKSILKEPESGERAEKQGDKEALLESVIADKDADSADKILQAVARTEAIATDKRWYFFDPNSETPKHKPTKIPADIPQIYRKWNLNHVIDRDSTAMSGAMADMAPFQELSEKSFLWIIEMACIQPATVPEGSFFDALLTDEASIHEYLRPKTVKGMFDVLGALPQAIDQKANVEAVNVYKTAYKGRDWSTLQLYIKFLGDAAKFVTSLTCVYTISLLARLCADSLVRDSRTLLPTVHYTMEALSKATDKGHWKILCGQMCANIYGAVAQEPLCLQIVNCIPCSTPRLRDLRRRISLVVFCQDGDLTEKSAEEITDLRKLVQVLGSPRFQISRNTDYAQLSALISLLDIAIGDGRAADLDLSDPQVEEDFNSDIDELAYQLKIIWSSISDRGTLSPSRIHTKRKIEKLRNQLLENTRTRLKPKQSIFDRPGQGGNREGAIKQSAFMTKHFKKPITNE